jgi:hypothetical protein
MLISCRCTAVSASVVGCVAVAIFVVFPGGEWSVEASHPTSAAIASAASAPIPTNPSRAFTTFNMDISFLVSPERLATSSPLFYRQPKNAK